MTERFGALLLVVCLTAGCGSADSAPRLSIGHAHLAEAGARTELDVGISFRPSPVQLEALDHGVALHLRIEVHGDAAAAPASVRLTLRYFPLSRRYQLHGAGGLDRSFAVRGYLLDALQRLRLPLPHDPCRGATRCRMTVWLDHSRLPGALRLPALVQRGWRVAPARHDVMRDAA